MDSHADHSQTSMPPGKEQGLEDRLRNMILTNAAAGKEQADSRAERQQTPSSNTSAPSSSTPSAAPASPPKGPSKPGKRRPNQAQRRQMASQYSIPIDATAHNPPVNNVQNFHHRGNAGHHSAQHPFQPSQQMAYMQPPPQFGRGQPSLHFGPMPWNGAQNTHQGSRGSPARTAQQHRGPSMFNEDPSQTQQWRRSAVPHYQHHQSKQRFGPEELAKQINLLEDLCFHAVTQSGIERAEIAEKEGFRLRIEQIIRRTITDFEQEQAQRWDFPSPTVELKCFGSLSSGFATKASDMDLGLFSPSSPIQPDAPGSPIPRLIERALLDEGIGARLLTRTRIPIIKLCEHPPEALYKDLLAQREKWEKGISDNLDAQEDDEKESDDPEEEADDSNSAQPPVDDEEWLKATEFEIPSYDGGEPMKLHLRQRSGTQLSTYYGVARKVLHKAGGREMKGPSDVLTNQEWDILNRVCQGFIRGLHDDQLRQGLNEYPSLSVSPDYSIPNRRSLLTVYAQIEGESIVRQWREWLVQEKVDTPPNQVDQIIGIWLRAMKKPNYGADPITYYREINTTLQRLKKQPAIQLLVLEQIPDELPTEFQFRTSRILDGLKSPALNVPRGLEEAFVDRYLDSIRPKDLRTELKAAMHSEQIPMNHTLVYTKHKALQLARELQRALDKGCYPKSTAADVQGYIKLLRSPLRKNPSSGAEFLVPVSKQNAELLTRIRAAPDPYTINPSHPKGKYRDRLEFPKDVCGVQCDINFSAHLALQNTLLLRCYSHTDPRVRPMVLFVKHWAKVRGINSGYRGTLSSYGYVLMVLHYLVNIAQPFVCPNLQLLVSLPPTGVSARDFDNGMMCKGYLVRFWRNEEEILANAASNMLNNNTESLGSLLRGFFEYFAQTGPMSNGQGRGFEWSRDVISIRTQGGVVTKQRKGWTGARTTYAQGETITSPKKEQTPAVPTEAAAQMNPDAKQTPEGTISGEVKEVRLRYLFAIEDPFELDHNVARTVTHHGIVSIRDEFRRAWRIIREAGNGILSERLLQDVGISQPDRNSYLGLLNDLHGNVVFDDVQ